MTEVNISYETLFEFLRTEKTKDELQKLTETFFTDVINYLKEKEDFFEHQKNKQDLFAAEEKEKAEKQLTNIKKILKEIYEKREKKIIEMAIDASRTLSIITDTSAMLTEEKQFYNDILSTLNRFREGILFNMQIAKMPEINKKEMKELIEKKEEELKETLNEEPRKEKKKGLKENLQKKLKIISAIPKFIGPDLNEYGPFEEGDDANIPDEIAEILINKGRAE